MTNRHRGWRKRTGRFIVFHQVPPTPFPERGQAPPTSPSLLSRINHQRNPVPSGQAHTWAMGGYKHLQSWPLQPPALGHENRSSGSHCCVCFLRCLLSSSPRAASAFSQAAARSQGVRPPDAPLVLDTSFSFQE